MIELKLQNPETQEKLTALLGDFNHQKALLIAFDKKLTELEGKKAKNSATLFAVKGEFESEFAGIKAKFEQAHELSIDDYTETKKLKAEFESRIDFFKAIEEELEEKIDSKREQAYTAQTNLTNTRKRLFMFYGEALINEFIQQHQTEIKLFRSLILDCADYDEITGKEDESTFNELLTQKLAKLDIATPAEFNLPTLTLSDNWKPKTPVQKHTESFQQQKETSFKRLLNNI